jgi:hypothetical protein
MNKTVVIRGLCLLVLVASIAVRFQANRAREAMIGDFDGRHRSDQAAWLCVAG